MPTSHPPDVGSLKKRLLSCYKEWESLDMKRLASYYSTKGDLIIFNDIEPPQFEGWEEFRQGEEKIISGIKWWKLEPVNVRVSTWGKVGLTTSTPVLTGESKVGKRYNLTIRHTAVWEWEKGRWIIMHEHWSFPLPSAA